MNSKFAVVILLVAFEGSALSQEKAVPPTKKMNVPSDTSNGTAGSERDKREPAKPDLELPDVLILGQDRASKISEEKRELKPVSPSLMRPDSFYRPVTVAFSRQQYKPALEQELRRVERLSWVGLQGGGYTTMQMEGGHWRRLELGSVRFQGWFGSSRGQFENSQFSEGGASAKVSYEMAPRVIGNAHARLSLGGRGLHGARFAETTRSARTGALGADLQYDINGLSDSQIGFDLGGTAVRSDTSSRRIDSCDDFWYQLFFGYTARLSKIQIKTNGQYKRDQLKLLDDTTSTKSSLGEIALEAVAPLSQSLSAAVGVAYQSAESDSAVRSSRASPYGRINFMPGDHLGLTFAFSSGFEYRTFSDYWGENPYLSHRIPLTPDESRFAMQFDAGLQVANGIGIKFGFSRKWMEKLAYWQSDPETGFIAINTLDDSELTEIKVGVDADLGARTRLSVSFITYSDRLDMQGILSNLDQIPYRPDFRLPLRASIQLLSDMVLTLQADLTGERRTQLFMADRLPAFGLMHLDLSKAFGDVISAQISARNVLDSSYLTWEHYPEMGVHVLLGLRAKW